MPIYFGIPAEHMYNLFSISFFLGLYLFTSLGARGQQAIHLVPGIDNNAIETAAAEDVQLLSRYIQIPSLSGFEKEAGQFLADYCREQGLFITPLPADSAGINFAATLYPLTEDKPVIWLQHHIDV